MNVQLLKVDIVQTARSITLLIVNPVIITDNKKAGNGVALVNTQQRLRLHYGQNAQLTHSVTEGTFRVKLVLPR